MLDWTGERFVPWAKEAAVAYEHLHRYIWASTLVKDKRVLDLASGEGYGSNLLATQAAYVCGVDIDEAAVQHSKEKYRNPGLHFLTGSITSVPIAETQGFDVIVCFEAIEHIEEHDALLREVKRLLKPGGLFIVSTPNKEYEGEEEDNPFHVKELSFGEFNTLLTKYFAHVRYLGQRLHPSSSLWPVGVSNGASVQEFVIERKGEEFEQLPIEKRIARYFVGVVSDAAIPLPTGSVLLDYSDELTRLVNERDREVADTKASAEASAQWLKGLVEERESQVREREQSLEWKDSLIGELNKSNDELNKALEWTRSCVQDLERTTAARDEALAWRSGQVEDLEKAKIELLDRVQSQSEQLQATQSELGILKQELAEIHLSRGWKLILKLRAIRDRMKKVF